jgi:16S rRNA (adenine1518-N6/adenine1519-N6)-dimethyltransferase
MNKRRVKALGQHFLKNPFILKKIVRTIGPQESDLIIEIGPGKGALTLPLATKAGQVIAIEKDSSLAAFLQKKDLPNLTVLEADVLKVDFNKLIEKDTWEAVKLVGNLPYSISSPLLFRIIGEKDLFSECVFLFQKEFAERICAQPGTKKYAPLSILFQVYYFTRLHFLVPPNSFSPPPRVESALVSLQRREKPLFQLEEEVFLKFLKKVFQHRRKTLLNNLTRLQYPPPLLREAFKKFGLANTLRPEQLTISQLVSLYQFLKEKPKKVKYP